MKKKFKYFCVLSLSFSLSILFWNISHKVAPLDLLTRDLKPENLVVIYIISFLGAMGAFP